MTFVYLWQNRDKPPMFSHIWLKCWAKRILTFPNLVTILKTNLSLKMSGSKIDDVVIISNKAKIEGKLNLLTIGKFTCIGEVHIAIHADVKVGSFVVINDGVKLLTASHDVNDSSWGTIAKNITIDDYAWIATDATILLGVHIGRGAVVGAGAVVSKDIPAYGICVGNPAKLINKQRVKQLNYNPVHLVACCGAWLGNSQH